jgi:hypothetical protein
MRIEIVHIEGYLLILSDEQISRGNFYLAKSLNTVEQYTQDELLSPNELKENGDLKIDWHLPLDGKPALDGVPLLPYYQNDSHAAASDLADKKAEVNNTIDLYAYKNGAMDGYDKAREKYLFTEADMRRAIILAQDWKAIVKTRDNQYIDFKHTHAEIINSLKKPEYPKYFDFVMHEVPCPDGIEDCEVYHGEIKTTVNALGWTVAVGSYNF